MTNTERTLEGIVAALLAIDASLSPVIGPVGVAALYKRSVFLSATAHPWLGVLVAEAHADKDFSQLRAALRERSASEVHATGTDLLQSFHDLLASMLGRSLTERLIRPALTLSATGLNEKDPTP